MITFQARNIDEFMAAFPEPVRRKLEQIRTAVHQAAPEAVEAIRYGIPTFQLNGNLVHFAAYETHIGFYPGPAGIDAFEENCRPYRTGKGTLQFPLHSKLPMSLIRDIIRFRVEQNRKKIKPKGRKNERVCPNGHTYVRSSECPVCPKCDTVKKVESPWADLPAPARRALEQAGIRTHKELAKWSEEDLLALHGLGPSSIPKLRNILRKKDAGK